MNKAIWTVLIWIIIAAPARSDSIQPPGDPIDQMMMFGGSQPDHIPRFIDTLSQNKIARSIALACLDGASEQDLGSLGIDSLKIRLDRLVSQNLLVMYDGKYFLTIPVFVGAKRDRLRQIANEGAAKLIPVVEPMIPRLRQALGNRPDVCFHMLWSRVIDANWWDLYRAQTRDQSTPPSLAWIVYPVDRYQVGTNFWSMSNEDELAISWGNGCLDCVVTIQDARPFLIGNKSAAKPSDSVMQVLRQRGCVDSSGVPAVYAYVTGDKVDQLLDQLKTEYAEGIRGLYDYQAVGKEFGVSPDDLFVILMHETAYSLFEHLDRSGTLPFPKIFQGSDDKKLCVQLASIRRLEPKEDYFLGGAAILFVLGALIWLLVSRIRRPRLTHS
jgi:hypothetical protein